MTVYFIRNSGLCVCSYLLSYRCLYWAMYVQMFQRVAAALPGMENTQQEKQMDDCILILLHIILYPLK